MSQSDLMSFRSAAQSYRCEHVFLSPGHDYRILDAQKELAFFVDGKFLSPPRRLSFQDAQRNELAQIRDKFLTVRPRFEVLQQGAVKAKVWQRFFNVAWVKHTVEFSDGQNLETQRCAEAGECLCRDGRPVAYYVQNQGFVDTFSLAVHPAEDRVLLLAVIVTIIEWKRQSEYQPNP